jgi:dihydrolipoamide dehydrogenase
MEDDSYDVIIIGAGPGGYTLALECGRRGMRTALIEERDTLGGTCLNVGCIPSKALLESSELFERLLHEAPKHGISAPDDSPGIDLNAMMSRKNAVVKKLTDGISALMKARNVDILKGRGILTAPGRVRVSSQEISAPQIVLASGSYPAALPDLPFDHKRVIDSTDALALDRIPKSLAVIGAGAVGLEIGSIWNRLGSKVTVIEALDRIVPGTDSIASRTLSSSLKKQGMEIRTGMVVVGADVGTRGVKLALKKRGDDSGTAEMFSAEKVLVSIGRKASVHSGLGPGMELKTTDGGRFIEVDEGYATSIDGLYAIGDVIGNPMLAHKAEDDAAALAALLAGEPHPPWPGPIPGIVYTEPEVAWAGETEDSLKASGTPYIKGQFPYAANGRALAAEAPEGFVKLLSTPGDGKLLGAVIVGRSASELIAEPVSIMAMGGCAEDIALTVHGHPTLSESIKEAALGLIGRPLHRS